MLDDETGEPLYQRADDTAEALKMRLVHRFVRLRRHLGICVVHEECSLKIVIIF